MVVIPTFTVQSKQVWPSTNYAVKAGDKIVVMWLSGEWSANPSWGILVNGNGNPSFPNAKSGYALPGAPEGALVGKVGNSVFLVGNTGAVPQNVAGTLLLAINDDVNGIYGPGYTDNIGALKVMIFKEN